MRTRAEGDTLAGTDEAYVSNSAHVSCTPRQTGLLDYPHFWHGLLEQQLLNVWEFEAAIAGHESIWFAD